MNYRYETIMSWIIYVKNGIWGVDKRNDYANDPKLVVRKYNELFKSELEGDVREHFSI